MWISDKWKDFEVIDSGSGEKLERWGNILLARPDPQVIWEGRFRPELWDNAHARYSRSSDGGGSWKYNKKLPEKWTVSYGNLKFYIKPMGFKHTGLFPEQATNWDYVADKIKLSGRNDIKVLNLFAYTGGATVAAAAAGAQEVVHVDSSKGMVAWAKENAELSGLGNSYIRFIVDDVIKFVAREKRRGRKYDIIIMDPPSYGRGPNGEVWKLEDELYRLLDECSGLLSENSLAMVINSYTTGLSPIVVSNMISLTVKKSFCGEAFVHEIGLPITASGLILPCGSTGRWER
ncbi:MAG: class I SAM-dependent methyltransferase [Monoglobales bacterium]